MLKWTVGPRKTPGAPTRTPSVSVGPCLNIRRAAARLHLRRSTPTTASSIRRANIRSLARGNKENDGYHSDELLSPRTRDSVYMRLDSLPAALRDVSNRIPTPNSTGSPQQRTPGSGVKRSRSRSKTRRARPSLPSRLSNHRPSSAPRPNEVLTSPLKLPPRVASHLPPLLLNTNLDVSTEASQNCVNNTLARQRLVDPDLHIDYSPCPVRATKSLVALRRRLADTFTSSTHSDDLIPVEVNSFDNPLYFSVDREEKHLTNAGAKFTDVEDDNITPICINSHDFSSKRINSEPDSVLEEKSIKSAFSSTVSPLTRHLSSLHLNENQHRKTPPSPLVNYEIFHKPNLLNHDITDPKFLSLYSLMDSSNVALNFFRRKSNSKRVDKVTKDDQSDIVPNVESVLKLFDNEDSETNVCEVRKRNSIPRARTVSEDGPPLKAQPILLPNGHLGMPLTNHNALMNNTLGNQPIKTPNPDDTSRIRLTSKRRRKSDRRRTKSVGEEEEEESLKGVGDGIFTSRNCDSLFNNNNVELASLDSSQEEYTLKRQGCIRRRPRHLFGNENRDANSRFGLTLPLGIPSPFSPENARSWYSQMQNGPSQTFSNITLQRNYSISTAAAKPHEKSSLQRNTTWSARPTYKSETITSLKNTSKTYSGLPLGPSNSWSQIIPIKPSETDKVAVNTNLITESTNTTYLETHLTNYVSSSESSNLITKSTVSTKSTYFLSDTSSVTKLPELNITTTHFGLTLANGIPSPPTPIMQDTELPGILPLSQSPAVVGSTAMDANETWKAMDVNETWKGRSDNETWKERCAYDGSSSDETWNSHSMHFMTSDHMNNGDVTCTTDCSSQMQDGDTLEKDSFVSVAPSPQAVVERRSRSRRCLRFTSPGGSMRQRRASRRVTPWKRPVDENTTKGELDLSIQEFNGQITIHVIAGKNLHKAGGRTSNAYVKVALVPSTEERTFHRTSVHRDSSAPRFDQKFSFELQDGDLDKRILLSVWHRDKEKRRSEFLGCTSFAVKHAVKKEVSGYYRLLSQSAGASRSQNVSTTDPDYQTMMARHSDSSVEEVISLAESDVPPTPAVERRRAPCPLIKKSITKTTTTNNDDSSFLRHLELEPDELELAAGRDATSAPPPVTPNYNNKGGRTPFTTTRTLVRHGGSGFGFSIAWTQPPRIERVEPGQPADQAGLKPGDYVIFVEKDNVVTLPEEQILSLIHSCGNNLTLEVYRRTTTANGFVKPDVTSSPANHRSSISCSAATTNSLDLSKRRLHLPQVTFSSEAEPLNRADARRRAVYQLVNKEQQYAQSLQFGVSRFLLPLAERKDLLTITEHLTLFQNIEELLRLSEDILDQLIQEDHEPLGLALGRVYLRKIPLMAAAYRRYCSELKQADCLLVAKTKNNDFMHLIAEPAVPRRRPDLTAFLHKPLEHYREILKLLQTILNFTKVNDDDYPAISKVVRELQITYREMTSGAGLMEPEGEGRLLLSLQDLESRLVFTRCKPFVLSAPGRQWIFGGDLSRVEGRAVRPFWGLLFSDMILFAKVSRDRVLFITEEPLSLLAVTQACFIVKKKATDFRLLMDGGPDGDESPVPSKCGPDMTLSRQSKKNMKHRTVCLRAPTAELKAVWQNLIQRQIIYLNTARGGTPTSSPLESPDQPTTLSFATLDSISLRRQTPLPDSKSLSSSQRHLDELIEHKCRQLGKSGANKGSALHLSQWMKGQLGGGPLTPDDEPITEVWSPTMLRRRSEQLQLVDVMPGRGDSRLEELEVSDTEVSLSRSPSRSVDSQVTIRSPEHQVPVCQKCHKTCLAHNNDQQELDDEPDYDDNDSWGPLMLMGMTALKASIGLGSRPTVHDPFSPAEVLPDISIMPPTPDTLGARATAFQWDDADISSIAVRGSSGSRSPDTTLHTHEEVSECQYGELEEDSGDFSLRDDQSPPYKSLSSSSGLKRFGTLASLEMFGGDDTEAQDAEDPAEDATDSEEEDEEWDSDADETTNSDRVAEQNFEVVTQSIRGWTARAGSFVAEKMALFERLGEDSRAVAFLDRYLRTTTDDQGSPPNSASGGVEDECSNSVATSGEEVWGTPTSGGELLDEELSRTGASFESISSPGPSSDDTELMMDELLASSTSLLSNGRGFPSRRRLEPLPEEEDVESTISTPCSPPPVDVTATPSPEQGNGVGGVADSCQTVTRMSHVATLTANDILRHQPPSFFKRLSLRKNREDSPRAKTNSRLLGFLSGKRSSEDAGSSARPLFRLFGRDAVDDIPTTLPASIRFEHDAKHAMSNHLEVLSSGSKAKNPDQDKQLERRFWKQLRRRRNSTGTASGINPPHQTNS